MRKTSSTDFKWIIFNYLENSYLPEALKTMLIDLVLYRRKEFLKALIFIPSGGNYYLLATLEAENILLTFLRSSFSFHLFAAVKAKFLSNKMLVIFKKIWNVFFIYEKIVTVFSKDKTLLTFEKNLTCFKVNFKYFQLYWDK